jgi:threonine/homoserine/homoserine lactone efflux protein
MNFLFLLKCFVVGVSAASALGPVFVLTFNRGALKGFLRGFFTALGAALGDGFLFFLGLVGILSVLEASNKHQLAIDFAGGLLLLIIGISMFFAKKKLPSDPITRADSLLLMITKTFLSTVLNPLAIFFFMFISSQILSVGNGLALTRANLVIASAMTGLGSLLVLSLVAYIASRLGNAISPENLRILSIITGCIILCIGTYFFFDAARVLIRMYNT